MPAIAAVSSHRRTTRESQRLADRRGRCGDAEGLPSERGDEGRDLEAASAGAERSRDRAAARPCAGERERPPGENGRHPAEGPPAPQRCLSFEEREEVSPPIAGGQSTARSPGRWAAHTRRSRVRSTVAAGAGATAPTPQSARPGGVRGGRGRQSSSCPSFAGWSRSASETTTPPSRSRAGCDSATPTMRQCQVSHETIYRALYVQARGTLRRELTRHLRRGRSRRYARSQSSKGQGQGKLTGMVMISERPPEVEDRAVPGRWEGDLLMGGPTSAIATLVERQTRYCSSSRCPVGAAPSRSARRSSRASPPCRPSFAARSPGIGFRDVLSTGASRSSPGSRSTSATPKAPGSGARTRTPTACCASTSRSERASPGSAKRDSTRSPRSSTAARARRSASQPRRTSSPS